MKYAEKERIRKERRELLIVILLALALIFVLAYKDWQNSVDEYWRTRYEAQR